MGGMGLPLNGMPNLGQLGGMPSLPNMGGFNAANASLMSLQANLNMQMALATAAAKQMHNTGPNNKNKNEVSKNPHLLNGFPNIMKPLNLPNLVGAKRPTGALAACNQNKIAKTHAQVVPNLAMGLKQKKSEAQSSEHGLVEQHAKSIRNANENRSVLDSQDPSYRNKKLQEPVSAEEERSRDAASSHGGDSIRQDSNSHSKSEDADIEVDKASCNEGENPDEEMELELSREDIPKTDQEYQEQSPNSL